MKIIKIVFGLIAALILGWIIAALAVLGIYYLRTGHILPENPYSAAALKNAVPNSDLLTLNVADSSGQPAHITAMNPVEQVSIPPQTSFAVSWQVADTLSSANAACTLLGWDGKTTHRSVDYNGTLQVASSIVSTSTLSISYVLQCKAGEKTYIKGVLVIFE